MWLQRSIDFASVIYDAEGFKQVGVKIFVPDCWFLNGASIVESGNPMQTFYASVYET